MEIFEKTNEEFIVSETVDEKGEEPKSKEMILLEELNEKFDTKIQNDEWKNKKYDEMHTLMLKYQDDLLAKTIDPLLKSYIQLSDGIKKDIRFFEKSEGKEEVCEVLNGIVEQIDTILFDYDVEPYTAELGFVNAKEQKIVKAIHIDDEELDNHVAEILTTGYKKNEKVFRMERVNIFKYAKSEDKQ